MASPPTRLRDAAGVAELVDELVVRLGNDAGELADVAIIGVRRGGVALARRIADRLGKGKTHVDVGNVDIGLYRDDARLAFPHPEVHASEIPFEIDGRHVVLVDDVFWTGRTARAAFDAVLDYGRPKRLWLVTLVERKGRELPIVPDVAALCIDPPAERRVELRLVEDGHDADELWLVDGRGA